MSASLGLYRLQLVDRQIDHAQAQLEVIRKTLENDLELIAVMNELEKVEKAYQQCRADLKEIELEVGSQRIKIEQAESSLYGGKVQNPKELQDLQKDVSFLKRHLATLEERELDSMLLVESVEKELQVSRGQLEQIRSRRGDEHKKLMVDQSQYLMDLERLQAEREAAVNPIEISLLTIYDDLRRQKRGVAVTDYVDSTCSSCGAALNASVQQIAKSSNRLAFCPVCGRILYSN